VREIRSACVPLPAPGGPSITRFSVDVVAWRPSTYWPRRPLIRVFFMNPS
jgi:hypothetical protein